MPHLFSPFTLKGVTVRNRIAMSPMTMYRSVDGKIDDFHLMYLGARAAGGFGLVFPEQIAITPDGRTTVHCAGLWDDDQMAGYERLCSMIKLMGGTPAIQLGHTGRKGSLVTPWEGGHMLGPDHPNGWQTVAPSPIAYGGDMPFVPRELTVADIADLHQAYADTARRAAEVGFEWIELHFAHGYLGAEFFSPLSNKRTDEYGGSLDNRVRFHLEAIDAVRAALPERLPLTMRLGVDDLHPDGVSVEESIVAIAQMKEHGLDLADVSLGFNTDEMSTMPFDQPSFMIDTARRIRDEVQIPMATSWNLGVPAVADQVIREESLDMVFLGRPALANAHWPVWAARELGYGDPFGLVPEDWAWWLRNFRADPASIGWPVPEKTAAGDAPLAASIQASGWAVDAAQANIA